MFPTVVGASASKPGTAKLTCDGSDLLLSVNGSPLAPITTGGSVGGANGNLQYNNGGAFGGVANTSIAAGLVVFDAPLHFTAGNGIDSDGGGARSLFIGPANAAAINIGPNAGAQVRLGGATDDVGFYGAAVPQQAGWTVSNPAFNQTLDVAASDLNTVREVLGTLLSRLDDMGVISF